MDDVYKDTCIQVPLIFILSPGSDPLVPLNVNLSFIYRN